MAVNEALNAYSTTAASNTPAGTDNVGSDLDDHLRDLKKNSAYAARFVEDATLSAAATIAVTALHRVTPVDPNTTGASVTITLPTVATAGDGFTTVVRNTTGAKLVIIDGNGAETVDGAADLTLSATNQAVALNCDGAAWFSVGEANFPAIIKSSDYSALSASASAMASGDILFVADASDSNTVKTQTLQNAVRAIVPKNIVQVVTASTSYYHTVTAQFTSDDTLPTTSETGFIQTTGPTDFSASITAGSTSNLLLFDVEVQCAAPASTSMIIVCLFEDASSECLAVWAANPVSSGTLNIKGTYWKNPADTSSHTYKLGLAQGSNQAVALNGFSGSAKFGGGLATRLVITEVSA